MTVAELIAKHAPKLWESFQKEPWSYRLEFPSSLDDKLEMTVWLLTGVTFAATCNKIKIPLT